jgi:hypothetical protein
MLNIARLRHTESEKSEETLVVVKYEKLAILHLKLAKAHKMVLELI